MNAPHARDDRLDIIRGLAMLTIAVNHVTLLIGWVGYKGRRIPSLSDLGQSSAAELFVALSGYMIGLVYLRRSDLTARLTQRMGYLYRMNLAAFLVSAVVVALADDRLAEATGLLRLEDDGAHVRLIKFLLLLDLPALLDILPMYILLMAGVPLAARLWRRSTGGFACICLGLYFVVQVGEMLAPDGSFRGFVRWSMNPLAWQLLFYGMMAVGAKDLHARLFDWLEASAARAVFFIALFIGAAFLYSVWGTEALPWPTMDGRTNLGPTRVVHCVLTLLALCSVITLARPRLTGRAALLVARVGRETLVCYVWSIPLTYAAAALWLFLGATNWLYLGLALCVLVLVVGVAWRGRLRNVGGLVAR